MRTVVTSRQHSCLWVMYPCLYSCFAVLCHCHSARRACRRQHHVTLMLWRFAFAWLYMLWNRALETGGGDLDPSALLQAGLLLESLGRIDEAVVRCLFMYIRVCSCHTVFFVVCSTIPQYWMLFLNISSWLTFGVASKKTITHSVVFCTCYAVRRQHRRRVSSDTEVDTVFCRSLLLWHSKGFFVESLVLPLKILLILHYGPRLCQLSPRRSLFFSKGFLREGNAGGCSKPGSDDAPWTLSESPRTPPRSEYIDGKFLASIWILTCLLLQDGCLQPYIYFSAFVSICPRLLIDTSLHWTMVGANVIKRYSAILKHELKTCVCFSVFESLQVSGLMPSIIWKSGFLDVVDVTLWMLDV